MPVREEGTQIAAGSLEGLVDGSAAVTLQPVSEAPISEENPVAVSFDFAQPETPVAMGGLGMPQEKRVELLREFRAAHGHVECAQLLKGAVERGEERKCHCDRMVAWCMDWVSRESGLE